MSSVDSAGGRPVLRATVAGCALALLAAAQFAVMAPTAVLKVAWLPEPRVGSGPGTPATPEWSPTAGARVDD